MEHISYNSVELIPNLQAKAAFCQNSQSVFEEDGNITPVTKVDNLQYKLLIGITDTKKYP